MYKILVVDDEEAIVDILEKFLVMNGFEVIRAVGGEEAIKILESDVKIDLMVLDMKMPKVNGMDVICRKESLNKKFPILLLTGSIDAQKYLERLQSSGFREDDIISKPVDLPVLLSKVKGKLRITQ
ncbi:MAG: response regulator [Candidatus Omnitrophica bacterium]|nr:response regulator [Candidatus Omnitrophota bacterium]